MKNELRDKLYVEVKNKVTNEIINNSKVTYSVDDIIELAFNYGIIMLNNETKGECYITIVHDSDDHSRAFRIKNRIIDFEKFWPDNLELILDIKYKKLLKMIVDNWQVRDNDA